MALARASLAPVTLALLAAGSCPMGQMGPPGGTAMGGSGLIAITDVTIARSAGGTTDFELTLTTNSSSACDSTRSYFLPSDFEAQAAAMLASNASHVLWYQDCNDPDLDYLQLDLPNQSLSLANTVTIKLPKLEYVDHATKRVKGTGKVGGTTAPFDVTTASTTDAEDLGRALEAARLAAIAAGARDDRSWLVLESDPTGDRIQVRYSLALFP